MASSLAVRALNREFVFFRTTWRPTLLASVIQPLMYLLGVGVGIGTLVDRGPGSDSALGGVSYFAFYASAIIATSAMNVGAEEGLWPTLDGFAWSHAYVAQVATPIEPRDVATAQLLHFAMRVAIASSGVALILACFDQTRTVGLLAAIPAGVLTGLAFAMPAAAWTASRDTEASFPAIARFGIIPMFLFGGAFYPISELPAWIRPVAWFTPLWHGIELCRGAVLGGLSGPAALGHVAFLAVVVGGGWYAATITFERRLRP